MALIDNAAMVLITGIPAAGKSTVADRLARRFSRGVHVRGDLFRRMVVTGRHEMTSAPPKRRGANSGSGIAWPRKRPTPTTRLASRSSSKTL
jgi:chloramphenicol 3-O-phosphotransferase